MSYAVSWPFIAWGEPRSLVETFWMDNTGKIGGTADGEPFVQNRTPEMFAEHRELPQCNGCYGNTGHNYPCPANKSRPLPPGPAFIPASPELEQWQADPDSRRRYYGVPPGYIWQPSTESTGAGWVRPKGRA